MPKLNEKAARSQLRRYAVKQHGCAKRVAHMMQHPEKSKKCAMWDRIILPALLFTCIFTPYEVAFIIDTPAQMREHVLNPDLRQVVNRIIDAIFVLDMIFQFFIMYPIMTWRGSVIWINSPSKIARHYLTSWFLIDLISILPFEFLIFAIDHHPDDETMTTSARELVVVRLKILKVIKCLRLLKMMRVLRASRIMERWQNDFSVSQQKITMAKFMFVLVIAGHWMACLWGLVGLLEEGPLVVTWVKLEKDKGFTTSWELYIAALHWSIMTLTSIGYGDIVGMTVEERIVGIIAMLFAGCLWANVIGGFSAAATSLDQRRLEFNTNMDELNQVMQEHNLPQQMRSRLRYFFYQKHDLGSTPVRLNHLLEQMSPELCREVCMFVHKHWLDRLSLFKCCTELFMVEVSTRMRPQVFAPEELFGDLFVLYILHSGIVSMKAGMRIFTTGRIWGKDFCLSNPILLEDPSVLCFGFAGVLTLRKKQFFEVADMFPADKILIRKQTVRVAIQRGVMRYCAMKMYPELYGYVPPGHPGHNGHNLGPAVSSGFKRTTIKSVHGAMHVTDIRYTGLAKVAATQAAWIKELKTMNRIPLSVMEIARIKDGGSVYDFAREMKQNLPLLEEKPKGDSNPETPPTPKAPTEAELNGKVEILEARLHLLHAEFEDQKQTLSNLLDVMTKLDMSMVKVNKSIHGKERLSPRSNIESQANILDRAGVEIQHVESPSGAELTAAAAASPASGDYPLIAQSSSGSAFHAQRVRPNITRCCVGSDIAAGLDGGELKAYDTNNTSPLSSNETPGLVTIIPLEAQRPL